MSKLLVILDKKADVSDGVNGKSDIPEEEKFKFRDILTFKLSFWLVAFSCVIIYMTVFPFIQVV